MQYFGYSQLVEQLGRVIFGLSTVWLLSALAFNDGFIAAAGTSGAAYGGIVSWLFALIIYRREFKPHRARLRDHKPLIKKIIRMAIPIALGASIFPLLTIIDSTMVIARLRTAGFGDDAGIMYSYLSFYGAPIIGIAEAVIIALQVSLLPMIARSYTLKDKRLSNQVYMGIRLAMLIGLPMAFGIAGLSKPILMLLYPSKEALIGDASVVLMWLGLGVVFLAIYQATTGILQGVGQYKKPVVNLVIGAVVKVILGYILLGIPSINVNGAAISTLITYALAALLNVGALVKLHQRPAGFIANTFKVIASNLAMLVTARQSFVLLSQRLDFRVSLLLAIGFAIAVYGILIFGLKLVSKSDFQNMEGQSIEDEE